MNSDLEIGVDSDSSFFHFQSSTNPVLCDMLEIEHLTNAILADPEITPTEQDLINNLPIHFDILDEGSDGLNSSRSSISNSSSADDYTLVSLDDFTSVTDIADPLSEVALVSQKEPETSVTSKLKSVLISRQRSKQNVHDDFSTVDGIYSNVWREDGQRRNCHNTRDDSNGSNNDNRVHNSVLRFPPCCVCGGTASGLHYGVNTCEPCKGFFTRYLKKGEDYNCIKNGNCVLTNQLRGNCSACRLKKCLALGMSRKNSRLGRYSLARRMETIMTVNKLEGKGTEIPSDIKQVHSNKLHDASVNNGCVKKHRMKRSKLKTRKQNENNDFSHNLVNCLIEYMDDIKPYGDDLITSEQINEKLKAHYNAFVMKRELFGNMKTVPKEEYYTLRQEFGIEIDRRIMYLKNSAQDVVDVISRYCAFGKQIPGFTSLSNKDQSNLLKSSRYDFFMILMHESYNHEQQVFLAHNGVAFHREEVADKFFSRQLVLNVCDMYHRLQKLNLSMEEKALLIAISLVFTDRCVLENPALVDQMQVSLTQLLREQLEKACKVSASRRFTRIIDCLTVMRDSSELYLREYHQLCDDQRVIEEVPQMKEMLFEYL